MYTHSNTTPRVHTTPHNHFNTTCAHDTTQPFQHHVCTRHHTTISTPRVHTTPHNHTTPRVHTHNHTTSSTHHTTTQHTTPHVHFTHHMHTHHSTFLVKTVTTVTFVMFRFFFFTDVLFWNLFKAVMTVIRYGRNDFRVFFRCNCNHFRPHGMRLQTVLNNFGLCGHEKTSLMQLRLEFCGFSITFVRAKSRESQHVRLGKPERCANEVPRARTIDAVQLGALMLMVVPINSKTKNVPLELV